MHAEVPVMVLGMSTATFTLAHVMLSLTAIGSGSVVAVGMWSGERLDGWTGLFLATTVLTSVTGFLFHSARFAPPHLIGLLSLLLLLLAILARYSYQMFGPWRWVYVLSAMLALYLNVFVAVAQAFQKLPLLQPLAPTGTEPPFAIAEGLVLAAFTVFTVVALRRFYPARPTGVVGIGLSS